MLALWAKTASKTARTSRRPFHCPAMGRPGWNSITKPSGQDDTMRSASLASSAS